MGSKDEQRKLERDMVREAQSIIISIGQLMCCREDVIFQEIEEKTQGQRRKAKKGRDNYTEQTRMVG